MNNTEKLNSALERVLGVQPGQLDDNADKRSVPNWDSFAGLMLIAELEKEFGVQFSIAEVDMMQTLGGIKKCLTAQGIDFV